MNNIRVKMVRGIFLCIALLSMLLGSTCQFVNVAYTAKAVTYTVTNGTYWIINAHSGKALTVYNSGTAAGTNVIQSENVNGINQRWLVSMIYNPTYANEQFTLIMASGTPGLCLSAANSSLSNGVNVELGTTTEINSHWDITQIGTNGNYKITSKCSSIHALTVQNSSSSNVYVKAYASADWCNDEWIFVPVSNYSLRSVTVKVQLDPSVRLHYTDHSEFWAIFADAAKPFYNKYSIQLIPSFYNLQYIPADDCPNTSYTAMCYSSNPICGNVCTNGYDPDDEDFKTHHKNLYYNAHYTYETSTKGNFDLRLIMTAQNACYINTSGSHSNGILGLCNPTTGNLIVKCNEYWRNHMLNVRVIQHELSHAFGCPDHDPVANDPCIMAKGYDSNYMYNLDTIWCSDCEAIMAQRNVLCLSEG